MKAAVCHGFGEPVVVEELEFDPRATTRSGCRSRPARSATATWRTPRAGGAGGCPPSTVTRWRESSREVGSADGGLRPRAHVVVTLVRSCGSCHVCRRGQPALCPATFALDERSPLRAAGGGEVVQGLRTAGFAEQVLVHRSQVIPVPRELPLDRACLRACGVVTGYGSVVTTAGVSAGDSLAVIGAGGVGLNSIQGAILADAGLIVAIDPAADTLATALEFGAPHAIDPAGEDAPRAVRAPTEAGGVDCPWSRPAPPPRWSSRCGSSAAVARSSSSACRRPGSWVEIEPAAIAHDGIRILGSKLGSTRPAVDIPLLAGLYLEGHLRLDELISSRSPLTAINDALGSAARGEALRAVITF